MSQLREDMEAIRTALETGPLDDRSPAELLGLQQLLERVQDDDAGTAVRDLERELDRLRRDLLREGWGSRRPTSRRRSATRISSSAPEASVRHRRAAPSR